MNGQLILREWKEKLEIPLLFLALLAVVVGALLAVPGGGDLRLLLTGSVVLVFLPFLSLMIGAIGFSTEIKDGAWAFIFSRPVRKSTVWVSKFIALFGYLAATLLIDYVVLSVLPGVRARLSEFAFDMDPGRISPWTLCLVFSFSLFVLAFSLSALTDKLFQIIFISLFVCLALYAILLFGLYAVLVTVRPQFVFMVPVAWFLAVAGLAVASLVTFCRADFSQPRRKALGFLKWSVLFLIPALLCVPAAAWIGRWLSPLEYMNVRTEGRLAFIVTNHGLYRYDAGRDSLRRLEVGSTFESMGPSHGGGKIVWLKAVLAGSGKDRDYWPQLWVMDEDGRRRKPLLQFPAPAESPLAGQYILNGIISRDGSRVFFVTRNIDSQAPRRPRFWLVNIDGSGLRSYDIGVADNGFSLPIGWAGDSRRVIVWIRPMNEGNPKAPVPARRWWLCLLDSDSGAWQVIAENPMMVFPFGLSPAGDRMGVAFAASRPEGSAASSVPPAYPRPSRLSIYDLATLNRTDLLNGLSLDVAHWDPTGMKIAFLADGEKRLGVYSLTETKIVAERTIEGIKGENHPWAMDWAGEKIALSVKGKKGYLLRVYDENLGQAKDYAIPGSEAFTAYPNIYGLGTKIFVQDSQHQRLWVFDPAKGKWRKLF